MRPSRLWALARQDWAIELGGRQGWLIPGLLLGLLSGPAAAPSLELPLRGWTAQGDVPPEVAALPQSDDGVPVVFRRSEAGVLEVVGEPPRPVREALDRGAAAVSVVSVGGPPRLPGRTVLFGLISASTLSGAVATSLGGERQRRTLGVLLSAAVSRGEVVVGKALAWVLLGLVSVVGAAATSLLLGRVEPGPWLLPLVTLPVSTVALGFWLVRRAADVMSGTATSMRVLPAAVSILGLAAFVLGAVVPWWGALVPIGGALIASGDTWPGWGPPALAAASNLAFSAAALAVTWRDLEEHPAEDEGAPAWRRAAIVGGLAAATWWLTTSTALLYAEAGNAAILDRVPLPRAVAAGALCLLAGTALHLARTPGSSVPVGRAPAAAWAAAVPVAALSWAVHRAPWLPLGWPTLAERLHAAAACGGPAGVLAIVADEVLFRGWLPTAVGPVWAVAVATLVKSPLDPLGGLLEAAALTALARGSGSVLPGLAARLLALALLAA